MNSGGKAFPIISATANFPLAREKKQLLGKPWITAASRRVMERFFEGCKNLPLEGFTHPLVIVGAT
jgi:hypothetical protein